MAKQTAVQAFLEKVNAQIDAFWKARKTPLSVKAQSGANPFADQHPGMVLEIGNELLITTEIATLHRSLAKSLGRVVLIDQILPKESKAIHASAFGIQVDVDTSVARYMRAAYLQREQAWSAATANEAVSVTD